mmetsp:Transcript_38510/g.62325  ORF Transcript_38510/g.62325 Transcript_38510/m.62325 type:complete len:1065 (-) Transcript_38510:282-3476(-)|eukprot:CAMPEP_0203764116 /NCGR_PEP_ID=MMETSP0098-20131031/17441_1 /ASSEMBLY_ACC=CAM_ASM_000208 /TAXON_ID=96639 /ORGANISM=" , Strain NY0313808BC1" /LENGTH=1064 /DNA_ID=CAMNT_0050659823 /DNA_START=345 /DNA_END=3539 /DNA_ORIENTATION=+
MDPSLGVIGKTTENGRGNTPICRLIHKIRKKEKSGRNEVNVAKEEDIELDLHQVSEKDEHEQSDGEEETPHHHSSPIRHQLPLYSLPKARHKWGKQRPERHPSWSDLFFDLVFVGVVFKSGVLLAEKVSAENFYVFFSTLLVMYSGWFSRVGMEATLSCEDNYHKLMFVLQGLFVAFAAHSLESIEELGDYSSGSAWTFTICMMLNQLMRVGTWLEIYAFETDPAEQNTRRYAAVLVPIECVSIAILGGTLGAIATNVDLTIVTTMWLASYLVTRFVWLVVINVRNFTHQNSIPWDVAYAITRFGQYTMLMLGEGVLQIIIYSAHSSEKEGKMVYLSYIMLFVFCYLIMGMLQLLHYSTLPFRPEDHVMPRSRPGAMIWIEFFAFYSCAQVCVGVALKKLLSIYLDYGFDYYKKMAPYYWLLQGSLCAVIFLLASQQAVNVDIVSELGIALGTGKKIQRVARGHERLWVWLVRFFVFPVLFILVIPMHIGPLYTAIMNASFLGIIFVFQVMAGRFKRKRKLNRTVAAIIAVGKIKRWIARRRLEKEKEQNQILALSFEADYQLNQPEGKMSIGSKTSIEDKTSIGTVKFEPMQVDLPKGDEQEIKKNNRRRSVVRHKTSHYWKATKNYFRDTNFYVGPSPKLSWTNLHADAGEVDWADLFFDLVYVAICFRLNDLSIHELTQTTWKNVWVYFAIFTTMFECWFRKTGLQATYATPDVLHKVIDILLGCLLAFMASRILPSSRLIQGSAEDTKFVNSYLRQFAIARILYEVIIVGLVLEIVFTSCRTSNTSWAKGLVPGSVISVVLVSLSFWAIADDNVPVTVVVLFWVLSFFVNYTIILVRSLLKHFNETNTVPVDLHYIQHRIGELALITLGEGVLSIILTDEILTWQHFVNFILGYMTLCAVKLCFFETSRFDPATMGGRKSRALGILGVMAWPGLLSTMCALGGLTIWQFVRDPLLHLDHSRQYYILALPVSLFFAILYLTDLLHEGPDEWNFEKTQGNILVEILALSAKFVVIALPLLVPVAASSGWPSWATLLSCLVIFILGSVAQAFHGHIRKLRSNN